MPERQQAHDGATESLKGGRLSPVDIVSSATDFEDTRHVISGGFGLVRESTKLSATYGRGFESDYRSHSLAVTASTTDSTAATATTARCFAIQRRASCHTE